MGAFLAFLGRDGAAPGEAFARARAWIVDRIGLAAGPEAAGVVHFAPKRALLQGSRLAVGERGWVVLAGSCNRDADAIGREGLGGLDGGHAVAIRDSRGLTVQPDHLGRLHVYWAETPGGVLVSTSSLALARATSPEPDPVAVHEMLLSGDLFGDRTLFRSVRRMLGGRRYRFVDGRLDGVERLPSPVPPDGPLGTGDRIEALVEACRRACTDALRLSERPLADLTGGLDSRLVLGLLLAEGRSLDVTVTGPDQSPDVRVAKSIAGRLGLKLIQRAPTTVSAGRDSFDRVLEAAALCDGEYDAIEYSGIAAVHRANGEEYDGSINGSGGEVYRNYWWNPSHLRGVHDCVAEAVPRFANLCVAPPFMDGTPAAAHFEAEIRRCLEERAGAPAPTQLDHLYLHLRMQSWQGAISSATNRCWPVSSPLMRRGPLDALYALDPRLRLGGRLIHEMMRRLGRGLQNDPLTTGFPPQRPGLLNAWRFLPGLLAMPADLFGRLRSRRERRGKLDPAAAGHLRTLLESGAADYLRPAEMASAALFDRERLAGFLDEARRTGRVSVPLLGRLISVEFALRVAGGGG